MAYRRVFPFVCLAGLLLISASTPAAAKPKDPDLVSVLILYDTAGEYGWTGEIHARMLANLLGHFPVTYKASPVEKYRKGDVERYSATFYIGSTYDSPLPSAFTRDAWASCYFHPFYEFSALQQMVEGIQSLGFTFVPLSEDMQ